MKELRTRKSRLCSPCRCSTLSCWCRKALPACTPRRSCWCRRPSSTGNQGCRQGLLPCRLSRFLQSSRAPMGRTANPRCSYRPGACRWHRCQRHRRCSIRNPPSRNRRWPCRRRMRRRCSMASRSSIAGLRRREGRAICRKRTSCWNRGWNSIRLPLNTNCRCPCTRHRCCGCSSRSIPRRRRRSFRSICSQGCRTLRCCK